MKTRFTVYRSATMLAALLAVAPSCDAHAQNTRPPAEPASPLKAIRSIDYTVIFARDMEEMRHFYGDVMDFPVNRELSAQWIEYRVGSQILALTERGLLFEDAPTPMGALSLQLAFRVAPGEVKKCAQVVEAAGVDIVLPVTDQSWGHRTVFFRDPDGNVIEIYAEI